MIETIINTYSFSNLIQNLPFNDQLIDQINIYNFIVLTFFTPEQLVILPLKCNYCVFIKIIISVHKFDLNCIKFKEFSNTCKDLNKI